MKNPDDQENRSTGIDPAKVLLPLGLGTALSLFGDATLYAVLPTHTADAGITLAAVGVILSANRLIRLFLNRPAGIAYDRFSRRRLFIPAIMIGSISTAIYAATSGFWPLLAGRLLWGLAWSGIWVGGATIILDVSQAQERGRWTGYYQTWFFLGAALGAMMGGWLTDLVGYTSTMWIGAGVTAFGALYAYIFLPETRSNPDLPNATPVKIVQDELHPKLEFYAVISVNGINRFITAGVLAATLALLVQEQLSASDLVIGVATVTGFLLGLRTILGMFAAPFSGMLSDRFNNRWGITVGALLIGAIGMLLLVINNPLMILTGICFSSIAGGSIQSLMTTRTGDLVDQPQRGKAIGSLHTAGDLGSALGPVMAYALLGWLSINGLFLICAALFAISAGIASAILLRQKKLLQD
ncbi:MAG: MFS transporter [Anaerolineales bacterium]|jgi:MFS family permease